MVGAAKNGGGYILLLSSSSLFTRGKELCFFFCSAREGGIILLLLPVFLSLARGVCTGTAYVAKRGGREIYILSWPAARRNEQSLFFIRRFHTFCSLRKKKKVKNRGGEKRESIFEDARKKWKEERKGGGNSSKEKKGEGEMKGTLFSLKLARLPFLSLDFLLLSLVRDFLIPPLCLPFSPPLPKENTASNKKLAKSGERTL